MTETIVALDVDALEKAEELLDALQGVVAWYKVGLRFFIAHGRRAADLVKRRGGKLFLDLKLHDIPQTVEHAVQEAQKLGADAVSLHLLGGAGMLKAAAAVSPRPRLWGVTVLTSLGPQDVQALHPSARIPDVIESLARVGRESGVDAIICSPRDVPELRRRLPEAGLKFVTPGIRPAGADLNDQRRAATPGQAAALGIGYVVIGRPITHAKDPRQAAQAILAEMRSAAPTEAA